MRGWQQLLSGFLIALASMGILIGGLSLSLAEGQLFGTAIPTFTPSVTPYTPVAGYTPPPSASPAPTAQATLPPPPTNCPIPTGWVPIVVQPGDSMTSLANIYQITSEALAQANCLLTTSLFPGVILYVPPIPTKTSIPCGPPAGWVKYIVKPGDTLYRLSLSYGITVRELQLANCMGSSTLLVVGKAIYVPPWMPTLPTSTLTATPTMMPSSTPSPVYRTETMTPTFTPTPSPTLSIPATPTPTPTEIYQPQPSPTPTDTTTP